MAHAALACLILLALVSAGCGTTLSPAGSSQSVVLHDPAPGTLSVFMSVNIGSVGIGQGSGDPQSTTEVGLSFSQGEHIVQFAGNERVTCNGVDLALKSHPATFRILHAPAAQVAGTTVRCDYAAGGAVASVSLLIPTAPAITSLQNGAHVARSTQTLITYRFDSTTGSMVGIVALDVPRSGQTKAIAKLDTPGPLQATIDTSHFAPGLGSLTLTASLAPHIVSSGQSFKSVNAGGSAMAMMAVTWV